MRIIYCVNICYSYIIAYIYIYIYIKSKIFKNIKKLKDTNIYKRSFNQI